MGRNRYQRRIKAGPAVAGTAAPVAAFSGTPTSGEAPLEVTFTDSSTGTPIAWLWDFGDGQTSTSQNPVHEYEEIGDYTVTLTAYTAGGSDPEVKVDYITVEDAPSYEGPLDLVPGAVVAYGQRAMSASQLGARYAIIREDSGDTTQTFNYDASTGDVPTADIVAFLNGANGRFAQLDDGSGNAADVVQATGSLQPAWIAETANDKPGIRFDNSGIQHLATAGAFNLADPAYTIFVVCKPASSVAIQSLLGMNYTNTEGPNAPDFTIRINTQDTNKISLYTVFEALNFTGGIGVVSDVNAAVTSDAYSLMDCAFDKDTRSFYFNGASFSVADNGYPDQATVGAVGGYRLAFGIRDAVAESQAFQGDILEIIFYNSILSAPDRLALRQNIATYYGITLAP